MTSRVFNLLVFPLCLVLFFQNCAKQEGLLSVRLEDNPIQKILEKCNEAKKNHSLKYQVREEQMIFAEPPLSTIGGGRCRWGQDGNWVEDLINTDGIVDHLYDGKVVARLVQLNSFDLAEGSVVCNVDFQFPEMASFKYDDYYYITYNNKIVSSSYLDKTLMNTLTTEKITLKENNQVYSFDLFTFDWQKFFDSGNNPVVTNTNSNADSTYCIGQKEGLSSCQIPESETMAQLALHLDQKIIVAMANQSGGAPRQEIQFITTGDNDSTDCYHTPFSLQIRLEYLEP